MKLNLSDLVAMSLGIALTLVNASVVFSLANASNQGQFAASTSVNSGLLDGMVPGSCVPWTRSASYPLSLLIQDPDLNPLFRNTQNTFLVTVNTILMNKQRDWGNSSLDLSFGMLPCYNAITHGVLLSHSPTRSPTPKTHSPTKSPSKFPSKSPSKSPTTLGEGGEGGGYANTPTLTGGYYGYGPPTPPNPPAYAYDPYANFQYVNAQASQAPTLSASIPDGVLNCVDPSNTSSCVISPASKSVTNDISRCADPVVSSPLSGKLSSQFITQELDSSNALIRSVFMNDQTYFEVYFSVMFGSNPFLNVSDLILRSFASDALNPASFYDKRNLTADYYGIGTPIFNDPFWQDFVTSKARPVYSVNASGFNVLVSYASSGSFSEYNNYLLAHGVGTWTQLPIYLILAYNQLIGTVQDNEAAIMNTAMTQCSFYQSSLATNQLSLNSAYVLWILSGVSCFASLISIIFLVAYVVRDWTEKKPLSSSAV